MPFFVPQILTCFKFGYKLNILLRLCQSNVSEFSKLPQFVPSNLSQPVYEVSVIVLQAKQGKVWQSATAKKIPRNVKSSKWRHHKGSSINNVSSEGKGVDQQKLNFGAILRFKTGETLEGKGIQESKIRPDAVYGYSLCCLIFNEKQNEMGDQAEHFSYYQILPLAFSRQTKWQSKSYGLR